MAATSRFSFGDVVLVLFPFTDQSGTKMVDGLLRDARARRTYATA